MKMSKVARMIGINRTTILTWITHESLEHLFSEDARNEGRRELNENDIFIVNTINHLRQSGTRDWQEIARMIEDGYQFTDLSIAAVDVDTGKTPLQQFTRMLAIAQERDLALKQLQEAQQQLEEAEKRYEIKFSSLQEQYEHKLDEERKKSREELERLLREIAELRYEIGKLERDNPKQTD